MLFSPPSGLFQAKAWDRKGFFSSDETPKENQLFLLDILGTLWGCPPDPLEVFYLQVRVRKSLLSEVI